MNITRQLQSLKTNNDFGLHLSKLIKKPHDLKE